MLKKYNAKKIEKSYRSKYFISKNQTFLTKIVYFGQICGCGRTLMVKITLETDYSRKMGLRTLIGKVLRSPQSFHTNSVFP